MNTHNAYQPSTHPEHWGTHPGPVADRRPENYQQRPCIDHERLDREARDLIPIDMDDDDDAGEWEPVWTGWETALATVFVVAVFASGIIVGLLWPL